MPCQLKTWDPSQIWTPTRLWAPIQLWAPLWLLVSTPQRVLPMVQSSALLSKPSFVLFVSSLGSVLFLSLLTCLPPVVVELQLPYYTVFGLDKIWLKSFRLLCIFTQREAETTVRKWKILCNRRFSKKSKGIYNRHSKVIANWKQNLNAIHSSIE